MKGLWQDIRYGARLRTKDAGFTMIAVLILALGIGANSGIFSVMRQVFLERLPVPHPEGLMLLYAPGPRTGHVSSDEGDGSESFSYPMYRDLCDRSTVFASLVAKADFPVSAAFRGQTERAEVEIVSGNYFDALGVRPAINPWGRGCSGRGAALGIPIAYGFGKLVNSLLFGVEAFSFASIGIALLALTVVTAMATYGPARRATRIDPVAALRYE